MSQLRCQFGVFFYCNTTSFVVSLLIIVLLLDNKLSEKTIRSLSMRDLIDFGTLLVLLAAYAAGNCRDKNCNVYVMVVSLLGGVLAFIFLAVLVIVLLKRSNPPNHTSAAADNDGYV